MIWKYCTPEQCYDIIVSFHLFHNWPKEKQLACLYSVSNSVVSHYHHRKIPKRDGTMRDLLCPDYLLKNIQKNLLHNVFMTIPISSYAMAYYRDRDILKNASCHVGQAVILKMDIVDFFGSISFDMIYRKVCLPSFPPVIARLLAELCCYEGYLPQGAPTSPYLSNVVMRSFDDYMGAWCEKRGIIYTRYCDDMTFSGDFSVSEVRNKVQNFLQAMGFRVNHAKTKVLTRGHRQIVTGIVVNKCPQLLRAYRQKVRQEVYYCRKYGVVSHLFHCGVIEDEDPWLVMRYLDSLLGKIHFILHVCPNDSYFLQAKKDIQKYRRQVEEG